MHTLVYIMDGIQSPIWEEAYLAAAMYHRMDGGVYIPVIHEAMREAIIKSIEFLGHDYRILEAGRCLNCLRLNHDDKIKEILYENESSKDRLTGIYNWLHNKWIHAGKLEEADNEPVVLAYKEEGLVQGLQFGILTGRSILYVDNKSELKSIISAKAADSAKSLLIAYDTTLTVDEVKELLDLNAERERKIPIGFLYPYGRFNRSFIVIKTYLYEKINPKYSYPVRFYYPLEKGQSVTDREEFSVFIGSGGFKVNLLKEPSEFIFATPHSNGVDMGLGEVVLCTRQNFFKKRKADLQQVLPCFCGDRCNRSGKEIIGVDDLKNIVLFLYTCWGVILKKGAFDVRVSLAYNIVQSPYNPVLITTYAMSLLERFAGPKAADLYYSGLAIGECIQNIGDTIILFGDPEYTCPHDSIGKFSTEKLRNGKLQKFFYPKQLDDPIKYQFQITKEFFDNLLFTECATSGMRLIGLPDTQERTYDLERAVQNLKQYALLYDNRIVQNEMNQENIISANRKLVAGICDFQENWFRFYRNMVYRLGGFVRFQVDRYFSMPQEERKGEINCPYCGSRIRTEVKTIHYFSTKRILYECYNCATILDGIHTFTYGAIECEKVWIQASNKVRISIRTKKIGDNIAGIGVIMEPFDKKSEIKMPGSFKQERINLEEQTAYSTDMVMELPKDVFNGSYYLNAIVMLNESIVFLRRVVYVNRKD